jgi:hypothetical protein
MMNLIYALLMILTVVTGVGGIWLAVWAWRTFRVSVFLWIVVSRAVSAVAAFLPSLRVPRGEAKLIEAFSKTADRAGLTPGQLVISMMMSSSFFKLVSLLAFALIAAAELAHYGPRLMEGFQTPRVLRWAYHLRVVLGLIGVLVPWVPDLALWLWMGSNRLLHN